MKLYGSTEKKIIKDKNGENVPHLEIAKVITVNCNIVNKDYREKSRVLHTFVPNKLLGLLSEILSTSFTFLKIFNSEFADIEVSLTDQHSKSLVIEDKINITVLIT